MTSSSVDAQIAQYKKQFLDCNLMIPDVVASDLSKGRLTGDIPESLSAIIQRRPAFDGLPVEFSRKDGLIVASDGETYLTFDWANTARVAACLSWEALGIDKAFLKDHVALVVAAEGQQLWPVLKKSDYVGLIKKEVRRIMRNVSAPANLLDGVNAITSAAELLPRAVLSLDLSRFPRNPKLHKPITEKQIQNAHSRLHKLAPLVVGL